MGKLKTQDEINEKIKELEHNSKTLPPYSAFGNNNRRNLKKGNVL